MQTSEDPRASVPFATILVADDVAEWRIRVHELLTARPEWQIIGEASDGLEAVHKARQLRPDLILLDLGMPTMNGIEAARRIRGISAASKILFLSENRSWDIVQTALGLGTGATGYVVKSQAGSELVPAIEDVLRGKRFVSAILMGTASSRSATDRDSTIPHRHEVAFYQDETSLVDGYAQCSGSALQNGHTVIIVATESQRRSLALRLERDGLDVTGAIAQGALILLDSSDALSSLMVEEMPDETRCSALVGDLVERAAESMKGERGRVQFCGGIAPILLSNGNVEGAIRLEHLWDDITRRYGVGTLCGYIRSASESIESSSILNRISAAHSAVHNLG